MLSYLYLLETGDYYIVASLSPESSLGEQLNFKWLQQNSHRLKLSFQKSNNFETALVSKHLPVQQLVEFNKLARKILNGENICLTTTTT